MNTETEEVKKVLKWVWIVFVVLAVFLSVQTIGAFKNLGNIEPASNTISVSGSGEAFSVPDIAAFSFSVSAEAQEVSEAQRQVTERMNIILAKLKSFGIEDRDIKTNNYSIWPKYVSERDICLEGFCPPIKQVQDGYTASHSITLKIRKTEDAGTLLALVGENGATNLSGISFTTDDPDKIMAEARADAIEDAREKAKILSKELGVRLVRVVSFHDNTGGSVPLYYAEAKGSDSISVSTPIPDIPAGENKVNVNVAIVYEIR